MKKLVALSLLVGMVYADQNKLVDATPKQDPVMTQGYQPQRGWGLDVFGDFLYWKASEDGIALFGKETSTSDRTGTGAFNNLHFQYDPGFRVGAGYHFKNKCWNLAFSWTRFHTEAKTHLTRGADDTIFSFLGLPGNIVGFFAFEEVTEKWHLHYDMLDLWLAADKINYLSFSFQPTVGLRGGWINQKLVIPGVVSNPVIPPGVFSANTLMKQNFHALGISLGLNTQYEMCCGFKIFGNFLGALVYGEFDSTHHRDLLGISGGGPFANDFSEKIKRFRPNLQFALGLDWDKTFYRDRLNLNLYAAYEQVYWFNQNQFFGFHFEEGALGSMSDPRRFTGDLGFGGLTVGAKLAF